MKTVFLLATVVLVSGCQSRPSGPTAPVTTLFEGLNLSLTDGVDREEAKLLAWRYFAEFQGNCGNVEFAKETFDSWHFRTVVGFSATLGEAIVVTKDGSRVSQKGSPEVFYAGGAWRYRGLNFYGERNGG